MFGGTWAGALQAATELWQQPSSLEVPTVLHVATLSSPTLSPSRLLHSGSLERHPLDSHAPSPSLSAGEASMATSSSPSKPSASTSEPDATAETQVIDLLVITLTHWETASQNDRPYSDLPEAPSSFPQADPAAAE